MMNCGEFRPGRRYHHASKYSVTRTEWMLLNTISQCTCCHTTEHNTSSRIVEKLCSDCIYCCGYIFVIAEHADYCMVVLVLTLGVVYYDAMLMHMYPRCMRCPWAYRNSGSVN